MVEVKNSKTTRLGGGRYRLEIWGFPVQMREDGGQWVDIDPAAGILPYELTQDGNKYTIRDKVTGKTGSIELTNVIPAGLNFEVIPLNNEIHFRHTFPSDKIPFEAQFRITGDFPFRANAFDDEGRLELETSFKNGILTEKLSEIRDRLTAELRPAKGLIKIDPTLTVQPSSKDAYIKEDVPDSRYGGSMFFIIYSKSTDANARAVLEFSLGGLPAGVDIDLATLNLYKNDSFGVDAVGRTYWAYRLTRTDWDEAQVTWNEYDSGQAWIVAGGDYTVTDGASATVPATGNWMSWTVTAQVEYAVDNVIDVEFLVRDATEDSTGYGSEFRSKEYTTDPDLQPKLVIDYTPAVGIENKSANMAAKMIGAGLI